MPAGRASRLEEQGRSLKQLPRRVTTSFVPFTISDCRAIHDLVKMNTMLDTTAKEAAPFRRRGRVNPGRLSGLTPRPHRPLSPRDGQAWRVLRDNEMKAWIAGGKTTPASEQTRAKPSLNRVSQTESAPARKRESALFAILTTAVFGAIGALLNESPEAIRRWLDFFRALSGF